MATRKPAPKQDAPMILIGASKESVTEARAAIMDILRCKEVTNQTKRSALQTLGGLCSVSHVTISGCSLKKG